MKKRPLTKSNKPGNRRSGKLTGKERHLSRRKSTTPSVKVQSTQVKASSKTKAQRLPKSTRSAAQRAVETAKVVSVVKQKALSPQIKELERGKHYKKAHEEGSSYAELASKFHCSKSLVRDLVALASLPKDLEEAYLQGKVGRKKALKMGQARKKEIEANAEETVTAKVPQKDPKPNPKPVMTEPEPQKWITEFATIIVDWVRSLKLAPYDLETFLSQVNYGLYGRFPRLFTDEAPKPGEVHPHEDPSKVIERCKVDGGNPQFMHEVINNDIAWLARWIQRVIPDWLMMKEAFAQAETKLRRMARMEI